MAIIKEDFEDGALPSSMTIEDPAFGVQTGTDVKGTYSFGPDSPGTGNQALKLTWQDPRMNGEPASFVELQWWETGSQRGCGYTAFDPNGVKIAVMATDNPGWQIESANGVSNIDSGNYQEWTIARMSFDWSNEEVTFYFEEISSGKTAQVTEPFINSASAFGYVETHGWNKGARENENDHYMDEFRGEGRESLQVSGVTSQEGISSPMGVYVYNLGFEELLGSTTSKSDGTYTVTFKTMDTAGFVLAVGDSSHKPAVHGPLTFNKQ